MRGGLVARDSTAIDKGRDDLFAATTPSDGETLLVGRAVRRNIAGLNRKLRYIDDKKAHLHPICHEDVHVEF